MVCSEKDGEGKFKNTQAIKTRQLVKCREREGGGVIVKERSVTMI